MRFVIRLLMTGMLIAIGSTAAAQDHQEQMAERTQALINEAVERLQLSDQQLEEIRPIMRDNLASRVAILTEYGVIGPKDDKPKRLNVNDMTAIRDEMDEVEAETDIRLGEVLSEEQMKEFLVLREERKQKVREEVRQKRKNQQDRAQ